MPRASLLDYFQPESRPAHEIALAWREGYRTRRWTYAQLLRAATHFARELESRGVAKGDRVLLRGENSGEWVAAFLGCIFRGAVAVPMDAAADPSFANRVAKDAGVRLSALDRGLQAPETVPQSFRLPEISGWADRPFGTGFAPASALRTDPVEIVFTSGTTAEPRGVVISHGNILANIEPIEREFQRYRRYEKFIHPLRFLVLLPLSHVFGQLLGIFLPQVIGATAIFLDSLNPAEVIRAVHKERVSVLATVPRVVESLRQKIEADMASEGREETFRRDFAAAEHEKFVKRWWRFRGVRRRFGWKFWALISGGAALPSATEQFFTRLGYAVIQGYGLTETASLVSLNHPFRLQGGSIGKAVPGIEMKLSPEGEILVRGENVAAGYWRNSRVSPVAGEEGWFYTGDLGERDASGNLFFKGRLKNVIVTPEGLNVYPQDLETELRKEPGVRDCVVVPLARDGNAEPCAVLLLREGRNAAEIVRRANSRLAPFQQMRHWFTWPGEDFPRTPTQKPALAPIAATVATQNGANGGEFNAAAASSPLAAILARVSPDALRPGSSSLQLTSLERVELMSALEDRYQVDLSESKFSEVDDLAKLAHLVEAPPEAPARFSYPRWPQSWLAWIVRGIVWDILARPAMMILGWPRVRGRQHLAGTRGPVLVVANHLTYFDPAYVLAGLPWRFRRGLAVAMDGELLESMRHPPRDWPLWLRWRERIAAFLVTALFNVFPLPRKAGFRRSFSFAGDLIDRGWNVLVFPEGERAHTPVMNPFRSGIGLLATRLNVPVVPVRLNGIAERRALGKHWAPPFQLEVAIGPPMTFGESESAQSIAKKLENAVADLR